LSDRSRAPPSHSRTVPVDIAGQLKALRAKHPVWGPKKMRLLLVNNKLAFYVPASSTIGAILNPERPGSYKKMHRANM
ncbi:helix-turn-helix domain-containing protein, partial [Enterobacter hormaechei]